MAASRSDRPLRDTRMFGMLVGPCIIQSRYHFETVPPKKEATSKKSDRILYLKPAEKALVNGIVILKARASEVEDICFRQSHSNRRC